ncbi:DUF2612 domain-containing protein [Entomomonas asaccharolytica]|uniref:DUF2612 domain-containing protein n=1 Tax=Entomomonas asaccharolytica TaxID=2785331 RepID=A0A974NHX1_9GAMM|nr:DUF2612 domain-containing protein [Entomomonas asaccharolytica]QQP86953.1 DUF2612 domain-containing protein [Entomomonas asaccharolytica]
MNYDDLLIWQYQDKPKARATIKLLADELNKSLTGLLSIPEALNINIATGKNLDLIGVRVGQSRVLKDFAPRALFGFVQTPEGLGFSKKGSGGGVFYRYGDPYLQSVVLSDDDYRFLIKCRIAKNYQTGTIPDIENMLNFLFEEGSAAFDGYDMSINVVIRGNNIAPFKRYAVTQLDMLPRPEGVRIKFYIGAPVNAFGFYGAKGAKGFNEGIFARYL